VDERTGDRTVVWHRDPRLVLTPGDVARDVIVGAKVLHVDDLDEDASIAAARIAIDAGVIVTSDIDRVTRGARELIALSTVPILSTHVPSALTGEQDLERAVRALRTSPAQWMCVTLGADGAMLLEGDRLHHSPAFAVNAVDTTGAGDVFRAGFIHGLLQSRSPADVLRFASVAAALSCTREGAFDSVPALSDIERALDAEL
jgi:sugar/nucleoside kinase (ribokinase family)